VEIRSELFLSQTPAFFFDFTFFSDARGFQTATPYEFNNPAELVTVKPGSMALANVHNHARAARKINSIH
jgi:hypothetical protein